MLEYKDVSAMDVGELGCRFLVGARVRVINSNLCRAAGQTLFRQRDVILLRSGWTSVVHFGDKVDDQDNKGNDENS